MGFRYKAVAKVSLVCYSGFITARLAKGYLKKELP